MNRINRGEQAVSIELLDPSDSAICRALAEIRATEPASFFTSVHWFRSCLAVWPTTAGHRLLRMTHPDSGRSVGQPADPLEKGAHHSWAILGARKRFRGLWQRRVLALNESLDEILDEPTIELNGFFGHLLPVAAGLDALLDQLPKSERWDEFRLAALRPQDVDAVLAACERRGLRVRLEKVKKWYWVDLERVRQDHAGDYLATRSSNTRQALRRARRQLESSVGPLRVDAATSIDESIEWLHALAVWHRARWTSRTRYVGFDAPSFTGFHEHLVRHAFEDGQILTLRVSAGDQPIAYLHNFVSGGRVHFMLSGIDYQNFSSYKAGLLAHWVAIEWCMKQGLSVYDFLAGESRYKESLATDESHQTWMTLWRPRLHLRIEEALRSFKRRLLGTQLSIGLTDALR